MLCQPRSQDLFPSYPQARDREKVLGTRLTLCTKAGPGLGNMQNTDIGLRVHVLCDNEETRVMKR